MNFAFPDAVAPRRHRSCSQDAWREEEAPVHWWKVQTDLEQEAEQRERAARRAASSSEGARMYPGT
eukprot:4573547-Pleurochrysis_carterae.AAC.4